MDARRGGARDDDDDATIALAASAPGDRRHRAAGDSTLAARRAGVARRDAPPRSRGGGRDRRRRASRDPARGRRRGRHRARQLQFLERPPLPFSFLSSRSAGPRPSTRARSNARPPRARRESRATLDAIDTSRDARARLVLGNPRAGSLVHVGQRGLFVHVVSARDRSRSRGRQLEKRPPRQQLSDERIPPAPDRHSRTRARRAVDPPRRVSWRPAARARRRTSKSASRRGRRRRKWCARASRLRPPRSFFFARARDPFDDVCLTPPSLLSPLK